MNHLIFLTLSIFALSSSYASPSSISSEKYLSYIDSDKTAKINITIRNNSQNMSNFISALKKNPTAVISNSTITAILNEGSPEDLLKFGKDYLKKNPELASSFIGQIDPFITTDVDATKNMIKFIIAEGVFSQDYQLLRKILLIKSTSVMVRLQRYVLFENFENSSLEEKMLFAASTYTDHGMRKANLEGFEREFKRDNTKVLEQAITEILLPKPPRGYKVDKYMIGSGKTSIVHLVTRSSDGKKFAWKVPNNDSKSRADTQKRQIDRSKLWLELEFGAETFVAPGGDSILQGYVEGQTLREMLNDKQAPNFLKTFDDKATFQLARLMLEAVAQKVYISSVNYENLIFSGDKWYIIDGSAGEAKMTHRETFNKWKKYCVKNWTRQNNYVHIKRVESFFDLIEKMIPGIIEAGIVTRPSLKKALDKQKKYGYSGYDYYSSKHDDKGESDDYKGNENVSRGLFDSCRDRFWFF